MVSEATQNSPSRLASEFLKGYDAGVRAARDEREPDPTQWFTKDYLDASVSKARAEALEEAARINEKFGGAEGADLLAARIRALKDKPANQTDGGE